jgi:hypothetical protein
MAALLSCATTASQAQTQTVSRAAASGVPLNLTFTGWINPDCTSGGQTTVRLVERPQHGQTRIRAARDFPTFRPGNVRIVCNTHRVPGIAAYYVSQRGYFGPDSTTIEIIYPNGRLIHRTYVISVR